MRAGILDGFQTIIPTAAAVLLKKRQMLRLTQQEIADRAKITLRQYQRLESGERSILTCSFGLACRVIEALDICRDAESNALVSAHPFRRNLVVGFQGFFHRQMIVELSRKCEL